MGEYLNTTWAEGGEGNVLHPHSSYFSTTSRDFCFHDFARLSQETWQGPESRMIGERSQHAPTRTGCFGFLDSAPHFFHRPDHVGPLRRTVSVFVVTDMVHLPAPGQIDLKF